ncbi:Helicase required for RNAi-mediated heterochromatin assembly 1 [Ceratocystis fimbriata CBS 114723]|uniref:Helicase required for RNAi-mediated heterochromatin assembly 1 n=1 Tax=Ceratocystis fimbriata CBS 114723 TaxID=1035309 RepID=A0A2C5WLZ5_9PEZI|nr:Helicase required for RNAi-mediated heterochromatin assembly 1 [Ceratocystis fimbriata CBS 114723]
MSKPELDTPGPPSWWRSEIPDKEEIISDYPILPLENDISELPESRESHAAIHYSLLRHEATELLRRSVSEYKTTPDMMDSMETKVFLEGLVADIHGISYRISFSIEKSPIKIDWATSKRLTAGSLVAISPLSDNFTSKVVVAVVTKRILEGGLLPGDDEHAFTAPRIDVSWRCEEDTKFMLDPDQELVMIQAGSSGLYEAVRHVMEGLKQWSKTPGNKHPHSAPLFDGDKSIINIESMVPPDIDFPDRNVDLSSPLPQEFSGASGLDPTQLLAFQMMLAKEISIVQGPPGTGKTFTSVSALKIILENLPRGDAILVTAQTNRALDQILMSCLNLGAKVARLGSRSREAEISERTVRALYMNMPNKPNSFGLHAQEKKRMSTVIALQHAIEKTYPTELLTVQSLIEAGLITSEQSETSFSLDWSEFPGLEYLESSANPLVDWLEGRFVETSARLDIPPEVEEDTNDDLDVPDPVEDVFAPQDQDDRKEVFIPVKFKYSVQTDKNVIESEALWRNVESAAKKHQDLYKITVPRRPWLYKLWLKKLAEAGRDSVWNLIKEITLLSRACNRSRQHRNAAVVRASKSNVLGCTTTGLTKFRELIEHVRPRVMLIEEAAETREANIIAAPLSSVEQMILVGDHMQLAPHAEVRCLTESPYNLNVSLFERLVNIGIPYVMLGVQRRMTPMIRSLIDPFYKDLEDHEIVRCRTQRPLVPGMGGLETFWFHHEWPERLTGLKSRINVMEAKMLVGLFRHLIQNGTPPDRITVLTFYKGQVPIIRMLLEEDSGINALTSGPFHIFTVDGFQGEENDVILLSLVRSPLECGSWSIGFLDDFRRTVVALSRARRGLYIFGNFENFLHAKKAETAWLRTLEILMEQNRQGPALELICEKHGVKTCVTHPDDLARLDGGCEEKCKEVLVCGHECPKLCHSYHHDKILCEALCNRPMSCGHPCTKTCSDECKCDECSGTTPRSLDTVDTPDFMNMSLDERLEMIIMSREKQEDEVNDRESISDINVESDGESYPNNLMEDLTLNKSSTPEKTAKKSRKRNRKKGNNSKGKKTGNASEASKFGVLIEF